MDDSNEAGIAGLFVPGYGLARRVAKSSGRAMPRAATPTLGSNDGRMMRWPAARDLHEIDIRDQLQLAGESGR
ncbi:MAG: hypothetical protein ACOH1V_07995 [Stenotrophomonas sp.]